MSIILQATDGRTRLGLEVVKSLDVFQEKYWFWIGAAALLGFTFLFNILFTFSLMYLKAPGGPQAIISKEQASELEIEEQEAEEEPRFQKVKSKKDSLSLSSLDRNNSSKSHSKNFINIYY